MTVKQDKILSTALNLFAKDGFYSTSTSKIAKSAGVSEGLIFRHFTNKEGLLAAILEQGQAELNHYFEPLFSLEDPKEILCKILETPFNVDQEQHNFWRLIYTLKWQEHQYSHISIAPMMQLAKKAFEALGYEDPEAEAEVLEIILDGAATVILLKEEKQASVRILKALKAKYKFD